MKLKRLIILTLLVVLAAGCSPKIEETEKPRAATSGKHNINDTAEKAIKNLGGEKNAFNAILEAWDSGYSINQIVRAIKSGGLSKKGVIKGVEPDNKPQNNLSLRSRSAFLLAFRGLPAGRMLTAAPHNSDEFASDFDKQKIMWTAWLIAVIGKGYSTEQIVDFMLDHDKPVEVVFPDGASPIISKKKIDPATGKIKINYKTGRDEEEIVKPTFPPKDSPFSSDGEYEGADKFVSDMAKDFEELLEGKGELRAASKGDENSESAKRGKFKPRAFRLKLTFLGKDQRQTMRSSDLILRIDAKGKATGSYSVETYEKTTVSETTRVEDGTFQGQAIYPKVKGQMIRLDLDGTRHMKISATTFSDGMTSVRDQNLSIKKMFQGVISVDYHKGSGFLYGEAAIFQWKIE